MRMPNAVSTAYDHRTVRKLVTSKTSFTFCAPRTSHPLACSRVDRVGRRVVDPDFGREPDAARLETRAVDHDHRRSIAIAGEPRAVATGSMSIDAARDVGERVVGEAAVHDDRVQRGGRRSTERRAGPRAPRRLDPKAAARSRSRTSKGRCRGDRPGSRQRSSAPAAPPSTVTRAKPAARLRARCSR